MLIFHHRPAAREHAEHLHGQRNAVTAMPAPREERATQCGIGVGGGAAFTVDGDTLSLNTSGVSLAYNNAHVVGATAIVPTGNATLTIASPTASSVASDYSFTAPAIADAAANITPKALTSTATIGGELTKAYDGTTSTNATARLRANNMGR